MTTRRTGLALSVVVAVALVFSLPQFAFSQDDNNDQDPPSRTGRLSYVTGSVSFQPGGQGDWLDAVANRPLTTGDNLWADKDARAEVQIGSTSIRLAPETSLTFLELDDNVTQIRLSVGSLYFRVRRLDSGNSFEVDTPNLAFNVDQPGQYRIDVNENGDQTVVTVWHGEGEISGGGSSYRISEGQQGTFSGTDQLAYDVGAIGQPDDFDQWALDRDHREDSFHSGQYVSEDMTGYEDLDEYGQWHNVDGYGNVWTPSGVPGDWAPYREGHWVFVAPWGWTWMEDEPWGFAPFHYGRWAFAGGGWCWVPGPVVARPVYSPALVAFVGGGGFSVGVGVGGGVGWFPLGPGEVFVPWYRTSPRYVQTVNVTNTRVTVVQVTNVYNNVTVNHVNNITYVNQRAGRGITVVDRNTFVNAQPVNRHIVAVNQREIVSAPVSHEVVRNIQPVRQSVAGSARPVRYAPPAPVMSRAVVATRQPVVRNRPSEPAFGRAAAPPPVRTVHAAPQAETLNRGAKGRSPGMGNAPNAGRPTPENRPNAPANAQRPETNTPRPGNPQAVPAPQRGEAAPRPGAPENNRPGARPNAPENNRTNTPENNRPNGPQENRPNREVPRPPSAAPERQQSQPERSNTPEANPRTEQPPVRQERPTNTPEANPRQEQPQGREQPNRPEANPRQEQPQPRQEPNTPEANPRQENPRGETQRPPQNVTPENRPSAPENRANPRENRNSNPPQNENRPAPETRQVPRPQSRPEAKPQRESKPESRGDKGDKGKDDNKSHFR